MRQKHAPTAQTVLEIVNARWGSVSRLVRTVYVSCLWLIHTLKWSNFSSRFIIDVEKLELKLYTCLAQIFFWFLMVTSIVVSGQLILGGSAVINALTGAPQGHMYLPLDTRACSVTRCSEESRTSTGKPKKALFGTGMNIYAAIFLIPFSVVCYSATGGLKV